MTREELKEHCKRQIQQFERVEKIMPVTPNDWKRYEEHKLILELLEQEPKSEWRHDHEILKAYSDGQASIITVLEDIKSEIDAECGSKQWDDYDYCSGLITAKRIIDKHMESEGQMDRLNKAISDVAYILDNLILLRQIQQTGDCNICKNRDCGYMPKAGQMVRYNCPFYKAEIEPQESEE